MGTFSGKTDPQGQILFTLVHDGISMLKASVCTPTCVSEISPMLPYATVGLIDIGPVSSSQGGDH